jgi:hypothetical protein
MKNKSLIFIVGVLVLLILPGISADIITTTVTKVYFEDDGKPYNGDISYSVKCYGYRYPIGPFVNKTPGTYTSEMVFAFSGTYKNYGDKIYETYYINYRQIDYCNLEYTLNGEKKIVEKYSDFPVNCTMKNQYSVSIGDKYYNSTPEYDTCLLNIDDYGYEECDKHLKEIPISKIEKDDKGNPIERNCELRVDMTNNKVISGSPVNPVDKPIRKGFWKSFGCFFKKILGKTC